MEKHGFEFKQKVAELLRTGDNGVFTTSLDKEADQTRLKNLCHLPLLEYHIDDPKFLNTRVVKGIYSKMAAAEGLSRSFGVEGKMPPWWMDSGATEEEKKKEAEFWKVQIGCNPPPGVTSKQMNWPSTLRKYVIRCYLFHLGNMDAVRDYYEYVNDDALNNAFNHDARVEVAGPVEDDAAEPVEDDNASEADPTRKDEASFTPNFLLGVNTWGSLADLPEKQTQVVLQYRAFVREDPSGKVFLQNTKFKTVYAALKSFSYVTKSLLALLPTY